MISDTFCVIPWVHLAIDTKGSYRLCCNQSYLDEDLNDGGYIDHLYYSYETSVEDAWNSDEYKNIRIKMLNGERIPPCRKCYREEAMGIKSARMVNNENYLSSLDELDPRGHCSTNKIKYVDVRLGNKCNLKCRMCSPHSSDQWISDERKTGVRHISNKVLNSLENMDWFSKDYFWDNLLSVMDNVTLLYFSGGEPALFGDEQSKLFKKCIEKGISKNIVLRYNTNLTIPLDRFFESWKEFKEVRINCSIDGFDKINDYIRYPSKWKQIESTLKSIYNYSQDPNYNISMIVMTTVQMYNIFGLIDLFEYLKQYKLFPLLNILNQPGHYNIRVLDQDKKEVVAKMLSRWFEKNKEWLNENDKSKFYYKFLGVIGYLLNKDQSHLYETFIDEARKLDHTRNQKIEDFVPEVIRN